MIRTLGVVEYLVQQGDELVIEQKRSGKGQGGRRVIGLDRYAVGKRQPGVSAPGLPLETIAQMYVKRVFGFDVLRQTRKRGDLGGFG